MGEKLLNMEDVCKLLQLSEAQVTTLVKKGQLRGFLDQKTYKFRSGDVQRFKKQIEAGGTVVLDDDSKADDLGGKGEITEVQEPASKSDTSRIDLADIEGEPGADESDQTSVLAPVEDKDEAEQEPEPVFEFSEDDLGLSLEDEGTDGGESVLIADESESSVDILETIDETSSESATSAAELDLEDESGSGEEIVAVSDDEGEHPSDADALGTILETEESSDESLEPLALDDVGETAGIEEVAGAEEIGTIPLADEPETAAVGEAADDTKMVDGFVDAEELAAAAEGTETVGVEEEALGEAVEEAGEVEEVLPEAAPEEERIVRGWGLVVPWVPGNIMLAAALVFMVVASVFVFGIMNDMGENWGWAQKLIEFVEQNLGT